MTASRPSRAFVAVRPSGRGRSAGFRALAAIVVATTTALALPAAADAEEHEGSLPAFESTVRLFCGSGDEATSTTGPVSLAESGTGWALSASADTVAGTLRAGSTTSSDNNCASSADAARRFRVEPGTSGLTDGSVVRLALTARLDADALASNTAAYGGASGFFGAEIVVQDLHPTSCDSDGCRYTERATFRGGGDTRAEGDYRSDGSSGWSLRTNTGTNIGDDVRSSVAEARVHTGVVGGELAVAIGDEIAVEANLMAGSWAFGGGDANAEPTTMVFDVVASPAFAGIELVPIGTTALNNDPVAGDDAYETIHDSALTVVAPGVLSNDTDADGDSFDATLSSPAANGQVVLSGDGSFTYTPDPGFTGDDAFTYVAFDGSGTSDPATVSIAVTNTTPTAGDDRETVANGRPRTITAPGVLANDADADGDALTARLASGPAHGSVVLDLDGGYTYRPGNRFTGEDTFTYTASDGIDVSTPATVTIDVADHHPVARPDLYTVRPVVSGDKLVVAAPGFLANDTALDGATIVGARVVGTLTGLVAAVDGGFTYTPPPGFVGDALFHYVVTDSYGLESISTVTLRVEHDPPVVVNDQYSFHPTAAVPTLVVDAAHGVLVNDSSPTGSPLSASEGFQRPSFVLAADGSFRWTPPWGSSNAFGITYEARDGYGVATSGQVRLVVLNRLPVGGGDSRTMAEDTALTVSPAALLGNDSDPDGDPITAVAAPELTSKGTLTVEPDGSFTFVPHWNFNGTATFYYRVQDHLGGKSAPVAVSVGVRPVNDAPVNVLPGSTPTGRDVVFRTSTGNAIQFSDVDAPTPVRITLSVDVGKLTLRVTDGLTFSSGDGHNDNEMTFTGDPYWVNNALDGLTFKGHRRRAAHLTMTSNDLGGFGSGGPLSDTDVVTIEP